MHQHDHPPDRGDGGIGGMTDGGGLRGAALMILCCLPMVAIFVLLVVAVLR